MENLPPTTVIAIGTTIASILAIIGAHFSSTANHMQNVAKLRSEWIDCLRKEISLFSSQVTTISLLWNTELAVKSSNQLTDSEFCFFRKRHKEGYGKLFESYSSVVLRLDSTKDSDNKLRELLDSTVTSFTGNNSNCGVNGAEKLKEIIEETERALKNERDLIEIDAPRQQQKQFWKNVLIAVAVVVFGVVLIVSIYGKNTQSARSSGPVHNLNVDSLNLVNELKHISDIVGSLPEKYTNIGDEVERKMLAELKNETRELEEHLDRRLDLLAEQIRRSGNNSSIDQVK